MTGQEALFELLVRRNPIRHSSWWNLTRHVRYNGVSVINDEGISVSVLKDDPTWEKDGWEIYLPKHSFVEMMKLLQTPNRHAVRVGGDPSIHYYLDGCGILHSRNHKAPTGNLLGVGLNTATSFYHVYDHKGDIV